MVQGMNLLMTDINRAADVIRKTSRHFKMNCTPFVRQYGILYNKWGDLLCQKEYLIKDIHQNLRSR